jgi:PAS domain S-box-containing protein
MESGHSRPAWNIADLNSPIAMVILACVVAVVCYLADRLVFVLGIPPDHIASFWPSTAFLVAALLLVPRKIWPVFIAAGLGAMAVADFENGVPSGFEIWFTLGNLAETLVATLGISRLLNGVPHLSSLKNLAKYLGFAVILVPSASALIGAIGSAPKHYWLQGRVWFFADALAFLTVTPAILNWFHEGRAWARKSHNYLEFAALMTSLFFFGYLTFMRTGRGDRPVMLYSLVPLLLWAALRLGLKGVSTSLVVVALLSIWGAAHGRGPFTGEEPLNNVLSLQLFLIFTSIPFTVLAVLVEEQKRAQQALIEEGAQLTEAQQLAQVGSWQWDPNTDAVTWSRELYRITGRDPNLPAATYKEHSQLLTAESWERLQRSVEEALRSGTPYELDLEYVRPDGSTIWARARGEAQHDITGQIVGLRGTTQDITERKLAEEALSKVGGRLIEAHEEERTWIARELHDDIGQQLALLANNLALMEQDLPDSTVEDCSRIREQLKRVHEISADVQAMSHRLHSSKLQYLGIVAAAKNFCQELSEQHKVEIDFTQVDIPTAVPEEISHCLFRIMQEALQNAVKHSGARHFEVELRAARDGIHLTVRDSGLGFDPEAAVSNRGLGLVSMQERVTLVKGTFSIDSRPGHGTTIHVRVPLSTRGESARAAGQ